MGGTKGRIKHSSHKTRFSFDASSYDEVCELCGATDIAGGGWGKLAEPCSGPMGCLYVWEEEDEAITNFGVLNFFARSKSSIVPWMFTCS